MFSYMAGFYIASQLSFQEPTVFFEQLTKTSYTIRLLTRASKFIPKIQAQLLQQVDLRLPHYRQIYRLSCEAASLQMTLAHFGIAATQDAILKQIGVSQPYESYAADTKMIWGDPNLGFVGNVNGLFSSNIRGMRGATGWGVNNGPIARVAKLYRPASEAYSGFTSKDVIRELTNGNPIIFWHVPDSYIGGSLIYETPEGKPISFFRNHVAVISGYEVKNHDTLFTIKDPLYGTYTVTKATLDRRMSKYNGDVVVVR